MPKLNRDHAARSLTLFDFHFVCPMPRSIVPSRLVAWCNENVEHGWLMQFPRKGMPTFATTVFLFSDYDDCVRFRDQYCYTDKYHKRPHEDDYMQALADNG
ncbi:hypothetical protein SAMN04488241_1055 [Sphingomonas rubra]|uniref:Uncharacterized protein n=2 Tax=Sphingomonas rubra TaxID=634430 RepID=A0A1I5S6V7_9SPHN|nr:hypothetical protein SAMN04488241_1055 [Sphingomonas rubra]